MTFARLQPLHLFQRVEKGEQPRRDVGTRKVPARLASAEREVILLPAGVDRRIEGSVRQIRVPASKEQKVRKKAAHPPVSVGEGADGEELQEVRRDDEQGVELSARKPRGEPPREGLHLRGDQQGAGGAKGDRLRQEVPIAPFAKPGRLVPARAGPFLGEMPEHRRVQGEEAVFRRRHLRVTVEDGSQRLGVPGGRPRPVLPRDPAGGRRGPGCDGLPDAPEDAGPGLRGAFPPPAERLDRRQAAEQPVERSRRDPPQPAVEPVLQGCLSVSGCICPIIPDYDRLCLTLRAGRLHWRTRRGSRRNSSTRRGGEERWRWWNAWRRSIRTW